MIEKYHCYHCGSLNTEPVIIINDWFDPRKQGNPWRCNDCEKYFVHKNCCYMEHLKQIREKIE